MIARMRFTIVAGAWGVAMLALLVLAGCRSSGGCGGGCGGGSCGSRREASPPPPPAPPPVLPSIAPVAAPPVTDARPYGGQKTCPVMGDALGGMGAPIPVTVQGETVYVCCKGCVAKVQRDPDKYLAIVRAERAAP